MPQGTYKKADVLCPFYRSDDDRARRINCEWMTDDGRLSLTFKLKESYSIQMQTFCCRHYQKCEIYRLLMENKYPDDE